jgi:hypothetical protein
MGQYYKPVSIDSKQYLNGHRIGDTLGCESQGLKLMEHSWIKNPMVKAALFLLSEGQAWNKTKIVWCGDYAYARDGLKVPDDEGSTVMQDANYYGYAGFAFKENPVSETIKGINGYILNHDSKEYVRLQDTPGNKDGCRIHPLPLLTCDGNGRGLGDFHGDDPNGLIGKWAYNTISYQTRKPLKAEGFTKLIFDLKEE